MATSAEDFELFTSLRYDPLLLKSVENGSGGLSFVSPSPFYMLVYHRDRMLEAARHFGFDAAAEKLSDGKALSEALLSKVRKYQKESEAKDGPLRIRTLYNRAGDLQVDMSPVPPVPLEALYPPTLDPPPNPKPPRVSPLTGGALTLGPTDSLSSSSSPLPPTIPRWTLMLDSHPTALTAHTSLKTTHRPHYDASRARSLPGNSDGASPAASAAALTEVFLYSPVGEITEGSISTPYFFRGGRWVTPPVGTPPAAGPFTTPTRQGIDGGPDVPFAGRWGHSVRGGGQRGTTRRWALRKGLCQEEGVERASVKIGEGVWVSNGVRGFGYGIVVEGKTEDNDAAQNN
ncbi:hypothetical protein BDY21DRAFT_301623 [Lineolata rhizophorae]|uniref:Aminotransferase class IV-domain-containing protein n=1 Tax=Lineolata rhizophorae TaxID=578093 RepID=A0A6A6P465_9PEZI|nr:hypothetical protein BDY21DRAFT_301623 [Lineolata rhizophorae]